MKTRLTTKTLIIGAALLLTGAAVVFAHGGYWGGYGGHMKGYGMGPGMMGNGPGYGMGPVMMHGNSGRGNWASLTDEQRTQLDKAQEKFDGDNQGLREDIQDARQALALELNKTTPDESKVTNLQKELTTLEGKFDQKLIQHQLEIRKILPEAPAEGWDADMAADIVGSNRFIASLNRRRPPPPPARFSVIQTLARDDD